MSPLPFTSEQFFAVFARYNEAVWPAQLLLLALALACLYLVRTNRPRAVAAVLAALWAWMAVVYHFAFFSSVNPAAFAFGSLSLTGAAAFIWLGVIRRRIEFGSARSSSVTAGHAAIGYALVGYPALGLAFGHAYPAAPTFGAPCPTTIFTLGILLLAVPDVPRMLFLVPLAWSIVGTFGAVLLGVPEDYGLIVFATLALVLGVTRRATPR